jgi:hypothetical protein
MLPSTHVYAHRPFGLGSSSMYVEPHNFTWELFGMERFLQTPAHLNSLYMVSTNP